jgi:hypothetical protein
MFQKPLVQCSMFKVQGYKPFTFIESLKMSDRYALCSLQRAMAASLFGWLNEPKSVAVKPERLDSKRPAVRLRCNGF